MAHEAKRFECPSWNVDAWETKLKALGGHPIDHPVKSAAADSLKAMEKLPGTGDKTEKDIQANPEENAVEDVMIEEGVAP
ncbi:hypothetical protein Hanom_Chr03g00219351 [Helianthus anomalus]